MTGAGAGRSPWVALWAMVVGYFMIILDMTIVAVANPAIMRQLDTGVSEVVWASSAYLLAFATLLLTAGRLGDRYGPKPVYLAGLALFVVASLACGTASTIGVLIAARAVQGVGAALMLPQTMALITRTFPAGGRSAAMSLWGAVAGFANLAGPLLGGVLVDGLGWEWVFLVNIPVGVVGLVLAARYVPVLERHEHRFDVVGVLLSGVGMLMLVVGLQEGAALGWNATVWLLIVAGVLVLGAFVVHQARTSGEPLLPLSIFRDRNFALGTLAVGAIGAAVAAVMVPLYFYLEAVRGMTALQAALLLAPMAVFAMVVVPLIGRFGDRFHPRVVPTAGFALFAVTLVCFAVLMTPTSSIGLFLVLSAAAGIANACIWPTLAATATNNLPALRAGAVSGAYNAIRQVGSVLGTAGIAAVIANRSLANGPGDQGFGLALSQSVYLPVALLVVGGLASACLVALRAPAPAGGGDRPAVEVRPEADAR